MPSQTPHASPTPAPNPHKSSEVAPTPAVTSPSPHDALRPFAPSLEQTLDRMSPFEVKDLLISYAKKDAKKSSYTFLNAGRGNPNWIATLPREAFFLLGQFAMQEARRTMAQPEFDLAGEPTPQGCAQRFLAFLHQQGADAQASGERTNWAAAFLMRGYDYLTAPVPQGLGLDPDTLVHEWSEGIVGCEYPVPERILTCTQEILRRYLVQEMDGGEGTGSIPTGQSAPYDLFATEGGTAAMCYLFYSLKANFLVNPGDKIALMTPIFTPYIDIASLNDFGFDVTPIKATTLTQEGLHSWQYPREELEKLKDPAIKLLCLVNPSNPPSYAMDERSRQKLVEIVTHDNPQLIIISDDVYGTFVPHFRSIMHDLPYNTALVYSFSKYFGATGWRLATIALAHHNVFDARIAQLPKEKQRMLLNRYSELKEDGAALKFVDRLVADSRLVALNGTAGLSTPQQVQMALFALYALLDRANTYKTKMQELVGDRLHALWDSLGWTLVPDPLRAGYYSMLDIEIWTKRLYGEAFFTWLAAHFKPIDIVLRLAKDTGVVVLAGDGFDATRWSIRVALANLYVDDFLMVGKRIAEILAEYHDSWQAQTVRPH